jgi:hypothetical protein
MSDIINIDQFETVENIEISVFPTYNEINVNRITGSGGGGSGAVNSVNGQVGDVVLTKTNLGLGNVDNTSDVNKPISSATQTALDLKVDKVTGKGLSTNDYTTIEKTKLSGIQDGAEVNVNADWDATTGDAVILNKPTIPSAITQTSQLTNNGADGINPFITALDIPVAGQASTLVREVKNMTGATLTKGTVVYISGANGNKALVSKALATTDALSSRTFGLLQSNILDNGTGNCVIIGDLSGLDTSAFTEGAQLYLSGTVAGTYTETKILAPTHLVYVGKVTRVHPTQGQIEVGIQNGYELEEIHDVAINGLADKQLLSYDSATQLWKNKSVTTADIADSTDKRYCTDAQKTIIGNTSGTNTGDQDLTNLVVKNSPIVGATKPKITFDAKGLVTAGEDLTASDIPNIAQSQVTNLVSDLASKQAILSYTPYKNIQTSQTIHTGTTVESPPIFTATIPASAFNSTDIIKILFGANKPTALGTFVLRLRINTTNNVATAPTLAFYSGTATAQTVIIQRNFNLNGGNLYGFQFSSSALTDIFASGAGLGSMALNPANQFFIFATIQLANASDNIIGNMLSINN